MGTTITIENRVTELTDAISSVLRRGVVENAVGAGVSKLVKDHFLGLNATRANQFGGKRTNFWAATAKSTNYQPGNGEVTISINKVGFRQRLEGGTIRPTGGRKYLTIPAVAEAYGKRAGEFSNLRFGFTEGRSGGLVPALVEASASTVKFGRARKDGTRGVKTGSSGGRAMFFLVRKVFQRADPSVLPTEAQITGAAINAVENAVAAAVAKGAKP